MERNEFHVTTQSRARERATRKKRGKKKEREKKAVAHGFVRICAPATRTRGTKTSVIFEGTKRAHPCDALFREREHRLVHRETSMLRIGALKGANSVV